MNVVGQTITPLPVPEDAEDEDEEFDEKEQMEYEAFISALKAEHPT